MYGDEERFSTSPIDFPLRPRSRVYEAQTCPS
jgi:hypothetical protein